MTTIVQGQVNFDLPSFTAWQSTGNAYIPSQISNSEFTQWLLQLFGLASDGTPLPVNTVGLAVDPVLGITNSLAELLLANGVQLYQEDGSSALPSSFSVNFLTIAPLSSQVDWDPNTAIFTPDLELILSGQAIEYSIEFNFVGLTPNFSGSPYPFFNASILPDRDGLYSNIQDQAALASYLATLGTLSEQQIQAELASFVTGLADNTYAVSRVNAFNLLAAYGTELNGTGSTVVLYNNLIVPSLAYTFSLDTNGYQLIQGSKVEEYGNTYLYTQDATGNYITQKGSTVYTVRRDGQDISSTTYAGFTAVGAESVSIGLSSVNQLLWTNGTSNADGTAATAGTTAFVWSLTSEWAYSSATSATIGYDTLGLETTFTYDLNADGYIGQYYTTFEANGNAGLYILGVAGPSGNQYFASTPLGATPYTGITRGGQDISTTTYAGLSAVGAESVSIGLSSVNQLLWTNGTSNANGTAATAGTTAFVWSLTSEWDYSSATSATIGYDTLGLETTFTYDLNDDGYIGQYYTTFEAIGNAGLYIAGVAGPSGNQYFASTPLGATPYKGITRAGQDISTTTYAGFFAVSAESVTIGSSSVNQLLWTNGTSNANGTAATAGTTAFVWSLTSEWDYSSATSATIGYDTLGIETTFTYDLNDDGYIGQYYTTFEANGNAGLYIAGVAGPSGNQYFASALPGTPSYKGITRAGQDISTTTYAGYSAVSAQIVSSFNQLLWTNGTSNADGTADTAGTTAFVWSLNSDWDYSSATSATIGYDTLGLETTFTYDLNDDGRIGQYFNTFEANGNAGLYIAGVAGPSGNQYFASTPLGATPYKGITRGGEDISTTTYAGFSAVSAESVTIGSSSVNQLLWTNGTSNANGTAATAGTTAFVWSLTSDWDYSSATSATIGYDTLGLETTFTYDLNDDGYIGQYYTTFEANGNAGLYIAGVAGPSGNQYFASALPGTPLYKGITRGGQDISITTYAGYSAVSAQEVSGVNQLLWTNGTLNANGTVATAGTTAFVWSLTSEWDYSSATSEAIGSSIQSQALEKTFYYDLDGLNGISNPVADSVTRTTVQSSIDVITGSIVDQFYIALAPAGSISFTGGGGSDAYQLYTSAGVQFASTGGTDYMAITDFALDDKIVLLGISTDYAIVNSGSVSSLYYGSSASGDLIASIGTVSPLDLNSSQFVYTAL